MTEDEKRKRRVINAFLKWAAKITTHGDPVLIADDGVEIGFRIPFVGAFYHRDMNEIKRKSHELRAKKNKTDV